MCCCLHLVLCLVVSVDLQGPGTDAGRKDCQGEKGVAIRREIVVYTRNMLTISFIIMLLFNNILL